MLGLAQSAQLDTDPWYQSRARIPTCQYDNS
jgi:hypothetical protein